MLIHISKTIVCILIVVSFLSFRLSNTRDSDLIIQLEVKSSLTDYIEVFYYDELVRANAPQKYTGNKSVRVEIEASSAFHKIEIRIPVKARPNLFRIDFGHQAGNVWEIKSISLLEGSRIYEMSPTVILSSFNFNSFISEISYNSSLVEFSTLKIGSKTDPFIESESSFEYFIEKLVNLIISSVAILIATVGLFYLNLKFFAAKIYLFEKFF